MRVRLSVAALAALITGVLGITAWNGWAAAPQGKLFADKRPGAIPVDTELVLAVDVSYSMDPEEQQLQREGYIEALTSREFMQALRRISNQLGARVRTVFSTRDTVEAVCRHADLVIGTVLVPGAAAPRLILAETVKAMKPGSVIVDVAIDQGGCSETSRPTTHSNPTYLVDDVVHYCVTNMPGAVARTSTFALNNMTLPFVLMLAEEGARRALGEDVHLRNGLNVYDGMVTHRAVADALKIKCTPAEAALRL